MEGWISLHRKILENPILNRSRVYSNFEAWIWLLLRANHKDNKFVLGSEVVQVKKGQMITSQKKLCLQFKWGNSKLRTFLKVLQSDNMIELKSTSKATWITINNYCRLQDKQITNKSKTNQKQIAAKLQPNTNNKDNKVNNVDNVNKFYNNIFIRSNIEKYGKMMLQEFYEYWSEKNMNGKKMKCEMEKTFEIGKRLNTWSDRDYGGHYYNHKNEMIVQAKAKSQQEQEKKYTEESDPEAFSKFMKDAMKNIGKGK